MARSKTKSEDVEFEAEDGNLEDVSSPDVIDDSLEPEEGELEDEAGIDAEADIEDGDWSESEEEETSEDSEESEAEDLDELGSEELEMLTEDELAETLVVDEAAELAAIRRAELDMNDETGSERGADEFLCQSCFLVLSTSQLSDKRRKLCVDCAG